MDSRGSTWLPRGLHGCAIDPRRSNIADFFTSCTADSVCTSGLGLGSHGRALAYGPGAAPVACTGYTSATTTTSICVFSCSSDYTPLGFSAFGTSMTTACFNTLLPNTAASAVGLTHLALPSEVATITRAQPGAQNCEVMTYGLLGGPSACSPVCINVRLSLTLG